MQGTDGIDRTIKVMFSWYRSCAAADEVADWQLGVEQASEVRFQEWDSFSVIFVSFYLSRIVGLYRNCHFIAIQNFMRVYYRLPIFPAHEEC